MQVQLDWKEGLSFSGSTASGFSLETSNDQDENGEKKGIIPLELMALSLGGCTGMDVISILQKKRQEVSAFEVKVNTSQVERHPRVWSQVEIEYIVTGKNIDPIAVERAIFLSADKYCPTQNMLKKAVEIDHSFQIIEG
jgi:putative redox protein